MRSDACMIMDGGTEICIDPTLPLLHLLGMKYSMLILGVLSKGRPLQFNRIIEAIPHSNSTIISRTLKEMQEQHIVRKVNVGKTVRYALTPFGIEMRESVIPLLRYVADRTSGLDASITVA